MDRATGSAAIWRMSGENTSRPHAGRDSTDASTRLGSSQTRMRSAGRQCAADRNAANRYTQRTKCLELVVPQPDLKVRVAAQRLVERLFGHSDPTVQTQCPWFLRSCRSLKGETLTCGNGSISPPQKAAAGTAHAKSPPSSVVLSDKEPARSQYCPLSDTCPTSDEPLRLFKSESDSFKASTARKRNSSFISWMSRLRCDRRRLAVVTHRKLSERQMCG